MNTRKTYLLSVSQVLACLLIPVLSFSQMKWENDPFEQKVFVENKGQFAAGENTVSSEVKYAASNEKVDIFFTPQGLIYRHDQYEPIYKVVKDEKGERFKREKACLFRFNTYLFLSEPFSLTEAQNMQPLVFFCVM